MSRECQFSAAKVSGSERDALGKPETGKPLRSERRAGQLEIRFAHANEAAKKQMTYIPAEQMSDVAKTSKRLCGVFIASPICAAIGTMRTAAMLQRAESCQYRPLSNIEQVSVRVRDEGREDEDEHAEECEDRPDVHAKYGLLDHRVTAK